jgi:PKD repeat protein
MKFTFAKPFVRGLAGGLLLGTLALTSCDNGGDAAPAPTANFDYEKNGLVVTFTNKSTNAKTYAWDFGDNTTSTEQTPVHTYAAYGVYTVKLSVTGDGGSASANPDDITLAKSSPVVIDGAFTDWATIPVASASVDGNGGSVHELKVDYDAQNIYFLVKGSMKGVYGIFINSDYKSETGATTPNFDYLWKDLGADYYVEGNLIDWGSLQKDDPENPDWKFDVVAESKTILSTAAVSEVGGEKYFEFSMLRSGIPNMSTSKIGLALKDIDIDAGWTTAGALPPVTQNEIPGVFYTLDLTK